MLVSSIQSVQYIGPHLDSIHDYFIALFDQDYLKGILFGSKIPTSFLGRPTPDHESRLNPLHPVPVEVNVKYIFLAIQHLYFPAKRNHLYRFILTKYTVYSIFSLLNPFAIVNAFSSILSSTLTVQPTQKIIDAVMCALYWKHVQLYQIGQKACKSSHRMNLWLYTRSQHSQYHLHLLHTNTVTHFVSVEQLRPVPLKILFNYLSRRLFTRPEKTTPSTHQLFDTSKVMKEIHSKPTNLTITLTINVLLSVLHRQWLGSPPSPNSRNLEHYAHISTHVSQNETYSRHLQSLSYALLTVALQQ